jgi:hypothetical protein
MLNELSAPLFQSYGTQGKTRQLEGATVELYLKAMAQDRVWVAGISPYTTIHHRTLDTPPSSEKSSAPYTTIHHHTPPHTTAHHRTPPHTGYTTIYGQKLSAVHHRTPPHTTSHFHRLPLVARSRSYVRCLRCCDHPQPQIRLLFWEPITSAHLAV